MSDLLSLQSAQYSAPALIDPIQKEIITYADLQQRAFAIADRLLKHNGTHVVLLRATPSIDFVCWELGTLIAGGVLILHDQTDAVDVTSLVRNFQTTLVVGEDEPLFDKSVCQISGSLLVEQLDQNLVRGFRLRPQLLLGTSGSTGSPKQVRLSVRSLSENARSISQSLNINSSDRAITSLPLSYSYGLSILHSHLLAGASVIMSGCSFTDREFWDQISEYKPTSLSGVPFTYESLKQMRFNPSKFPSIRTLTQAGGRLDEDLVIHFRDMMERSDGEFRVMYGQTEATARMSIASMNDLFESPTTVGRAIPGGSFNINSTGVFPDEYRVGHIVYSGPNVMLGYATTFSDLQKEDEMHGVLDTGDIGYLDHDQRLYITGRSKRIAKVFGTRISLDDVDRFIFSNFPHCKDKASIAIGDIIAIVNSCTNDLCKSDLIKKALVDHLRINHRGISVKRVENIPYLKNGKIDYSSLTQLIGTL
jgi:acyl-CoA synthetase (AMP-forming)/AMP-acid ligase II